MKKKKLVPIIAVLCLGFQTPAQAGVIDFIGEIGHSINHAVNTKTTKDMDNIQDGIKYYIQSDNTVQIEGFRGDDSYLHIPGMIEEKPVVSIAGDAFSDPNYLSKIQIPATLAAIGDNAFSGCLSLQSIEVLPENPSFSDEGGILYSADRKTLVIYPAGLSETEFSVPSSVKKIGNYAFASASRLQRILLSSVEEIGDFAFLDCLNLKQLDLPSTLEAVGIGAFINCSSLDEIELPDKITRIPEGLFLNCRGLTSIRLGPQIETIDSYAFANCIRLTTLRIPERTLELGKCSLYNCKALKTLQIDSPVLDMKDCFGISSEDSEELSLEKFIVPKYSYVEQQIRTEFKLPYEYTK